MQWKRHLCESTAMVPPPLLQRRPLLPPASGRVQHLHLVVVVRLLPAECVITQHLWRAAAHWLTLVSSAPSYLSSRQAEVYTEGGYQPPMKKILLPTATAQA